MFFRSGLALVLSLGFITGCEVLRELGSQCVNGNCTSGNVSSTNDCLVSVLNRRLIDDLESGAICMDPALVRDDLGMVACVILWLANEPDAVPLELQRCVEPLSPLDGAEASGPGCRVNQVLAPEAGAQPGAAGFYYSEQLGEADAPCRRGFRYTPGLSLPEGAHAQLVCSTALRRSRDGSVESVDPSSCVSSNEALAASGALGAACDPSAIPTAGFEESQAYLDTAANGCGGSPCLVYHLAGDPSPECGEAESSTSACASPESVAERVYCTCRCDVPADQQAPECRCPSDYNCTPVLDRGPFAGSYCVLPGTIMQL